MTTPAPSADTHVILAFDVGGTNSRCRLAVLEDGCVLPHPTFPETVAEGISCKADFLRFVRDAVARVGEGESLEGVAFAFAGPVEDHRRVRMTNWPDSDLFTIEELAELALDPTRVVMINDMVAGAYGLLQRLRTDGIDGPLFERLYAPEHEDGHVRRESLVYVAPGTGLGAAGIVHIKSMTGGYRFVPVSSEGQHTLLPVLDDHIEEVIEKLREMNGGARPSWEDVASGRGLAATYRALRELRGGTSELPDSPMPGEIAAAAVAGSDPVAVEALGVYYQCLGGFAQVLALTFHSVGGVFLGGGSTRHNRAYIADSSFLSTFLANGVQGRFLAGVPVTMLLADVNIDGALWCAWNRQADLD